MWMYILCDFFIFFTFILKIVSDYVFFFLTIKSTVFYTNKLGYKIQTQMQTLVLSLLWLYVHKV